MAGTSESGKKSAQSRGRENLSKAGAKGSKSSSGSSMLNKKGSEGLNRNR